ncbi:MAG: porin [Burkholderiaceae bacterium]|nr:porin [Burkholderiaceae bacterium]
MKKSLLAVAVAAALPGAAFAASNVTMYGIADVSVDFVDRGNQSRNTLFLSSGGRSTSRWGVRGAEDLGGGLKAIFQFEAGVGVDIGSNDANFFQRTSTVGLQGGFGKIRLGRTYTPSFLSLAKWDAMGYGLFGNLLVTSVRTTIVRYNNGIYYNSPKLGGAVINAAFSSGESDSSANPSGQGNAFDVSVDWAGGPANVSAYYGSANSTTNPIVKTKRMGIGGGFNMGAFKIVAGYSKADPDGGNNDTKAVSVGGSLKLGAGSLMLQAQRLKFDATNGKSTTFGVAYAHSLSKRTSVYAHFGTTRNDAVTAVELRGSGYAYTADGGVSSDPRAFGVGVRHLF